jgi:AcrR family transcriptional regulator
MATTKTRAAAKRTPGKRAQTKEATKKRIVAAALDLFQARGFERTTTKQIALKARVAEGTVFNYFPTKEDIALHFFEEEVDHAIDAVKRNTALRKRPLDEKLFALVQYQFDYLAPYESFIGSALVHALKPGSRLGPFDPRHRELTRRYLDFVQDLIIESQPKTGAGLAPWFAPHAFWVFYLGALLYWLHDPSPGKQSTMAFLDRSLKLGVAILYRGVPA